MILPLLLLAATAQAGPPATAKDRFDRLRRARRRVEPAAAEAEAGRWQLAGGGFLAHQCLGIAYATETRWTAAAAEFESRGARRRDRKGYALGGLLGAGRATPGSPRATRSRPAPRSMRRSRPERSPACSAARRISTAPAPSSRAATLDEARSDLDKALIDSADDPLAWLLSATLARRMNDLPRAQKDIAEALRRASDDASVQLEAGNIAALAGDEAGRQGGVEQRGEPQARQRGREACALAALKQFDTPTGKIGGIAAPALAPLVRAAPISGR